MAEQLSREERDHTKSSSCSTTRFEQAWHKEGFALHPVLPGICVICLCAWRKNALTEHNAFLGIWVRIRDFWKRCKHALLDIQARKRVFCLHAVGRQVDLDRDPLQKCHFGTTKGLTAQTSAPVACASVGGMARGKCQMSGGGGQWRVVVSGVGWRCAVQTCV